MYYPRDYPECRVLLSIPQWNYPTSYCDFETIAAGLYDFLSFGFFTFLSTSFLLYIIYPFLSAFYLICTSLCVILSLLHKIFQFHGYWNLNCCLLIHGNWITFRKDLLPQLLLSKTLVPTYLLDCHKSKNKTLSAGIICGLSKIRECSRKLIYCFQLDTQISCSFTQITLN